MSGHEATVSSWLRLEEHGDLKIPLERLIKDGRLDIFPAVLEHGLFRVYFKGNELVFQAGGWVGLLRINAELAVEVLPRVPIESLEKIIARSRSSQFVVLDGFVKEFASSPQGIPSIVDVMASRLVLSVRELLRDGLHYEYVQSSHIGSLPRGRISPSRTALHRLRVGLTTQTIYDTWERTYDVPANQFIRAAIRELLEMFEAVPDKTGRRRNIRELRQADAILAHASYERAIFSDAVQLALRTPGTRPGYPVALAISDLILNKKGIELRSKQGTVKLSPILIKMEDVFENYVRNVLSATSSPIIVKDGNLWPPEGAKRPLTTDYSDSDVAKRLPPASPDFVIWNSNNSTPIAVADVKYKIVVDAPAREDINQVLTYGLAYGCSIACLFYPRRSSKSLHGLVSLGRVGNISLYSYFVDLGAADLDAEQEILIDAVCKLCQPAS